MPETTQFRDFVIYIISLKVLKEQFFRKGDAGKIEVPQSIFSLLLQKEFFLKF